MLGQSRTSYADVIKTEPLTCVEPDPNAFPGVQLEDSVAPIADKNVGHGETPMCPFMNMC